MFLNPLLLIFFCFVLVLYHHSQRVFIVLKATATSADDILFQGQVHKIHQGTKLRFYLIKVTKQRILPNHELTCFFLPTLNFRQSRNKVLSGVYRSKISTFARPEKQVSIRRWIDTKLMFVHSEFNEDPFLASGCILRADLAMYPSRTCAG